MSLRPGVDFITKRTLARWRLTVARRVPSKVFFAPVASTTSALGTAKWAFVDAGSGLHGSRSGLNCAAGDHCVPCAGCILLNDW
jgi:hypothetical protein